MLNWLAEATHEYAYNILPLKVSSITIIKNDLNDQSIPMKCNLTLPCFSGFSSGERHERVSVTECKIRNFQLYPRKNRSAYNYYGLTVLS